MRALVITRNLPPLVGGMERLVGHIVRALSEQYQMYVVGPEGCATQLPHKALVTEIPVNPIWLFLLRVKLAAIVQAVKWKPDLVFAGSGLTAPFAWMAARLAGAQCVVYLHGLDIEAASPVYQWLWKPFFRRFDLVLVNSRFTRGLAESAGIPPEKIQVLNPGVELPDLAESNSKSHVFRKRHQLQHRPVLLYVGRITGRKGLLPFVRDILPGLVDARPDLKLVVVGTEPKYAVKREQSLMDQIVAALGERGLGDSVLFLGDLSDDHLEEAYFGSDALIFPVIERKRDHEGFGMVAVEAAAHGLPTVAFASGGVVDAVLDDQSGSLVPEGDREAFAAHVLEFLNDRGNEEVRMRVRRFAENLAWPHFSVRLLMLLNGLVKDSGPKT